MGLFASVLLNGIILIALGYLLLKFPLLCEERSKHFLRSKKAAVITFGAAALWFLWQIAHLGEADFGEYKGILLLLFSLVGILSFFYVDDFLSVRGLAALILLSSRVFLDEAYMVPSAARLYFVTYVYLIITIALFVGTVPFYLRDFFNVLFRSKLRVKLLAYSFTIYGSVLLITLFSLYF